MLVSQPAAVLKKIQVSSQHFHCNVTELLRKHLIFFPHQWHHGQNSQ